MLAVGGFKTCTKCDRELHVSCYHKGGASDGLRGDCMKCHRKARMASEERPGIRQRNNLKKVLSVHKISRSKFDAMLISQLGCCAICDRQFMGQDKKSPCIDHNHETGKIRGLLCVHCNTLVGLIENGRDKLARIGAYLQEYS